jgi:hypothetical protein
MEHVKCRLQVQTSKKSTAFRYKGPTQAVRHIVNNHGWRKLYQGWWVTLWREVPAFGLYFAVYDYLKDRANALLAAQESSANNNRPWSAPSHSHTWLASAVAGGSAGAITWGLVYPVDIVKSRIQTMPLDTPAHELSMWRVAAKMVAQHGWKHLWRGLGITLIRAFPVNGTIFPVYEFTTSQLLLWEKQR